MGHIWPVRLAMNKRDKLTSCRYVYTGTQYQAFGGIRYLLLQGHGMTKVNVTIPPKRQTTVCHTHLHVLLSARVSWARSHVCGEGEFPCNRSRLCVPQYRNCDTRPDCPDGSDEWNCCKYSYSVAASRRCVCLVPRLLTMISLPV